MNDAPPWIPFEEPLLATVLRTGTLALMMRMTARTLGGADIPWRMVWLGGVAFIAIELVAHAALAGRGLRNFYHGRG